MDAVFDAQFRIVKDAFLARGIQVEVAYTPAGEVDYLYEVGRLLTLDRGENVARIEAVLPAVRRLEIRGRGDLVVLSLDGGLTVPEALGDAGSAVAGERAAADPAVRRAWHVRGRGRQVHGAIGRVAIVDHFSASGADAELEDVMIAKLEELVGRTPAPDVVNLSAGTYTRGNWSSLGFEAFQRAHPDVVLVAAAGNDATDRPFYPAAYDWVVSVGALGPDLAHRAWFSNYGDWVRVYAPGEGHVNAYATGEYTYREPPKMPAVQNFSGMARWDGTSFAAPLVAGLIAARMARTGESAQDAKAAVLASAREVDGVGMALFPCGED